MALIVPNIAPRTSTTGERLLFNVFKRYFNDDYFIWYEPTIFGKKISFRPDFLLLAKNAGIIVVEVKDWSIDRIKLANKDVFHIDTGSAIQTRTNPEKQARQYIISALEAIEKKATTAPEKYNLLTQKNGVYKGKIAVPYSYLIAFPNISYLEWQNTDLADILNENHILLREDLNENNLEEKIIRNVPFQANLSSEQIDVLKWIFFPEIIIKPEQLSFLDTEQASLTISETFTPPEYEKLSTNLNIKLVRGTVGSGKTLILLKRAKYIREKFPEQKILILTYNKSLKAYLDKVYKEIGGDGTTVEILHFHKWCFNLLSQNNAFLKPLTTNSRLGLIKNLLATSRDEDLSPEFLLDEFDWIKERVPYREWANYTNPDKLRRVGRKRGLGSNEKEKREKIYKVFMEYEGKLSKLRLCDWADIPVHVLQATDKKVISSGQYDTILVDEAQDFAPSWFLVIMKMIKPKTGSIFIVGDGTQKIYRKDFTWKEVGIAASAQNTTILTKSYRNTHEILDAAIELIKESQTLIDDIAESGESVAEHENNNVLRHGPLPIMMAFTDKRTEYVAIAYEIQNLIKQGYQPEQIALLHRHKDMNRNAVEELHRLKIPCKIMGTQADFKESSVKICTLHSAKGLEFDVVFICGLDNAAETEHDKSAEELQEILDQERKLLYVGMTRARQRLYLTYSGVEPNWIVDRIKEKFTTKN